MITVGDKPHPWRQGLTVAELLAELGDAHPYAVVRINEEYVSRPHFAATPIPDGARVYLIPMIAGG